jgi:hypothetical protein
VKKLSSWEWGRRRALMEGDRGHCAGPEAAEAPAAAPVQDSARHGIRHAHTLQSPSNVDGRGGSPTLNVMIVPLAPGLTQSEL